MGDNDLQDNSAQLAREFPFAACRNSQARQTSADRARLSIARFYKHCREKKPGKSGYPRFQHDHRSVEDKNSGGKLEPDGKRITFTDGAGIGTLSMMGTNPRRQKTRSMATFPLAQIKRVRLVKRADGYYVQFAAAGRSAHRTRSHRQTAGPRWGLKAFYTDSDGACAGYIRHKLEHLAWVIPVLQQYLLAIALVITLQSTHENSLSHTSHFTSLFEGAKRAVTALLMLFNRRFQRSLSRVQQRLWQWMRPTSRTLFVETLYDLTPTRADLIAETRGSRQQLIILRREAEAPRVYQDRSHPPGPPRSAVRRWKQALFIIQPATLLNWRCQAFRSLLAAGIKARLEETQTRGPDHRLDANHGAE